MSKRNFFVLALVLLVFVPFVSAQSTFAQEFNNFINGLTEIIEPIAKLLVGDIKGSADFDSSDVLWSKVLFLILIFSVVYLAFGRVNFFSDNSTAHFVITLIIALLATRWIGDAQVIQSILLPYSALGITLSDTLPFVAWFLIVNVGLKKKVASIRRLLWVAFGVVFLFLWGSRFDSINSNLKYIYPVTAILAGIMAWMDGTINRWWLKLNLERLEQKGASDAIIEIKKKINELPTLLRDKIISRAEMKEREKQYRDEIKFLSKYS